MRLHAVVAVALLAGAPTLAADPPRSLGSGGFAVSPARVFLPHGVRSSVLTISNGLSVRKRFEVAAFTWRQGPDGLPVLEPTTDVFFFPSMIDMPGGTSRSLRIGVTARSGEREITYRVLITELKALPVEGEGGAVQVLMRYSVPVFLQPEKVKAVPAIEEVRVESGAARFSLVNRGNSNYVAKSIRVTGQDASGASLFEKTIESWYVLPGDPLRYALSVTPEDCSRLAGLQFDVETDVGPLHTKEAVSPSCTP